MQARTLSRRSFLTGSAGLAVGAMVGPAFAAQGVGKRVNIAVVGALGKGQSDTRNVAKDHNIVALVDIDTGRLEEAAAGLARAHEMLGRADAKAPRLYTDFRKMFDEMAKDIDAVIVSTPDHAHFTAATWAVKNGKHVCVQKPLCNTIWEVRELHRAARDAKVMTQMGNQGRTMEGQRLAKEWIEQGAIGKLQEVRLWTNRPIWPQGPLGKKLAECPPNVKWDLWLAQEAEEPYFTIEAPEGIRGGRRGNAVHPFNWRGWWQFGSGALGDMGCHIMDAAFSILGGRVPVKIEGESSQVTDLTAPMWSSLVYHFEASERYPALKVTWNDGTRDGRPNKPERDPRVPEDAFDKATSGMLFVGSEGVVFEAEAYCADPRIFPEVRFADVKQSMASGTIKKTETRSTNPGNPQLEWANCIANGGKPSSSFDYSAPLAEFVLLGNLAVRSGQTIEWDAATGQVKNSREAGRTLKRAAYRSGWL